MSCTLVFVQSAQSLIPSPSSSPFGIVISVFQDRHPEALGAILSNRDVIQVWATDSTSKIRKVPGPF